MITIQQCLHRHGNRCLQMTHISQLCTDSYLMNLTVNMTSIEGDEGTDSCLLLTLRPTSRLTWSPNLRCVV